MRASGPGPVLAATLPVGTCSPIHRGHKRSPLELRSLLTEMGGFGSCQIIGAYLFSNENVGNSLILGPRQFPGSLEDTGGGFERI